MYSIQEYPKNNDTRLHLSLTKGYRNWKKDTFQNEKEGKGMYNVSRKNSNENSEKMEARKKGREREREGSIA